MLRPLALSIALGLLTLTWRAIFDKIIAARGGAELVATWAQLQSIADLVVGVVSAGVAPGVAVLVAQAATNAERRAILRQGLAMSAVLAGVALAVIVIALVMSLPILTFNASATLAVAAGLMGFISVAPTVVGSYWTGRERRDLLAVWGLAVGAVTVGVAWAAPQSVLMFALVIGSTLPALVLGAGVLLWLHRTPHEAAVDHRRALAHFIAPSVAIGILSPLALIATRSITAEVMSVADVGVMQAIWRSAEWMTHLAGAVLALYFFPKLSAAADRAAFGRVLRRALLVVLVPTAIGFMLLGWYQRAVLASLYDASFVASDRAVAYFYLAEWLRIASWLFLYALYALRATLAVAIGEVLSLPLFAVLVYFFRDALNLEIAGLLYLSAFSAYLGFNYLVVASRRRQPTRSVT